MSADDHDDDHNAAGERRGRVHRGAVIRGWLLALVLGLALGFVILAIAAGDAAAAAQLAQHPIAGDA